MSNMKNANHLTVAYGDVPMEVLNFACKDFAMDTDLEEGETSIATVNDHVQFVYYQSYNQPVDSNILNNALYSLYDHLDNVLEPDLGLELEQPGYHCCNTDHIVRPKLACKDGLPDCIHCDVYRFVYYAQDCIVSVYYIKTI